MHLDFKSKSVKLHGGGEETCKSWNPMTRTDHAATLPVHPLSFSTWPVTCSFLPWPSDSTSFPLRLARHFLNSQPGGRFRIGYRYSCDIYRLHRRAVFTFQYTRVRGIVEIRNYRFELNGQRRLFDVFFVSTTCAPIEFSKCPIRFRHISKILHLAYGQYVINKKKEPKCAMIFQKLFPTSSILRSLCKFSKSMRCINLYPYPITGRY